MTYTVSITSQGQISIPAKLRRELGLEKSKRAVILKEKGRLIIEPVEDFLELGGSLKLKRKPLSNQALHDFVAKAVAKDYAKSLK